MKCCAPIIISVYNRFDHFRRCIESVQNNSLAKDSDLFILSDAPYNKAHQERIEEIRKYVRTIRGFKSVTPVFRETNVGAHISITSGINMVLEQYDCFIFLEDDIVVSNDFLLFMNDGLEYYSKDSSVFSICAYKIGFQLPKGYDKDIFFYPCNSPWGFATWKNRWKKVNLNHYDRYSEVKKNKNMCKFASIGFYIKGILIADSKGEINATDLRVYYYMFLNNMCSIFPSISKAQNWGFDGTGEHCGNRNYDWAKPVLDTRNKPTKFDTFLSYNSEILRNYRLFQERINGGIIAKYIKYTWFHQLYKKLKKKY